MLSYEGSINTTCIFNVVDGTIEMAGGAGQIIPAGAFQNNDLKNLVINSSSVLLNGAKKLYGKLSFAGGSKVFTTNDNLTLRSTATGTASVGDITNNSVNTGNSITGDVMVERYVPAKRAWRFLSVPTQNNLQTVHQAWQENLGANVGMAGNGRQITSNIANWAAKGFDTQAVVGSSFKNIS